MLLAMAASLDWEIHVIDVNSAFLNSEMPEDQYVYLRQPSGYVAEGKEDMVWLLLKALYGLKQSGRLWYQKLKAILTELGFEVCISDPCIFIRHTKSGISIICSHVDDLGLFCSSVSEVNSLKSSIAARVPIKDGGEMTEMLGIGITRDRTARTISLSHRRYIDSIVKTYGLQDANPVLTPPSLRSPLTSASGNIPKIGMWTESAASILCEILSIVPWIWRGHLHSAVARKHAQKN